MQTHRVGIPEAATRLRFGVLSLAATLVGASTPAVSSSLAGPIHNAPPPAHAVRSPHATASFGSVPISFEPNVGQAPAGVRFLTRGAAASLTAIGAVLEGGERPVTLEFVSASGWARATGERELPGKANYFVGNDPSTWKTDVATYASVRVEQLYAGVDLVWYGKGRCLEYDLVMAAGVGPDAVSFSLDGAPSPEIDPEGALVAGDVRFERPVAYQEIDGVRRTVPCGYVTNDDGHVAFELGDYDRSLPLVIDPEIGYTYAFADSSKDISISGIAVDSTGAAYVAGRTRTEGAGGVLTVAAFVAKLNPEGTALVYSTTISGSAGNEEARDIAVDAAGNAFITGFAFSSNFPTTAGAFQTTKGSPNGTQDAFVTKLGPAGDTFVYSSFLGGSAGTSGYRIAIDGSGNAHVAGFTQSSNFPTTSPAQGTFGGVRDAFLTKVNAAGNAKAYSTFLGGSQSDTGNGVAIDASGNAYVVGVTTSMNFPVTAGTIQSTSGGGSDGFWAKYDPAGLRLASSYIGGTGFDSANGIDVDDAGNSYLTGETDSANFPLASAIQSTIAGDRDVFVSQVNSGGSELQFSSFYGGSQYDYGSSVSLDRAGLVYVVGTTRSSNFPTVDPFQPAFGGGQSDAFILQVRPSQALAGEPRGTAAVQSASFLGGPRAERAVDTMFAGAALFLASTLPIVDTAGGENEEGRLDQVTYSPAVPVDLTIRGFIHAFRALDGKIMAVLLIRASSLRSCSMQAIPDARFSVAVPEGLGVEQVGMDIGVNLEFRPPQGVAGNVVFSYPRTLPIDSTVHGQVLVSVKDGTPPNSKFIVNYFGNTSGFDCNLENDEASVSFDPANLVILPGAVVLSIQPSVDTSLPSGTSITIRLTNGTIGNATSVTAENSDRSVREVLGFNVYAATVPNVLPVEANLFTTLSPSQTSIDVSSLPAGSFFVVTALTDQGESLPSNEVGGTLPQVTKLKVSASKIVVQGTGFSNDVQVFFGGLPFATAARLKKANTKVIQKGPLVSGQSLAAFTAEYLAPSSSVIILLVNGNGNGVAAEYTVP